MSSEKAKVCVIDDDDALRDSLTFLLRMAQIDVVGFASAAAFLDGLSGTHANCVITDVRMPAMSGIDLLRRLKELKLDGTVIVITSRGDVPTAVDDVEVVASQSRAKALHDEVLLASVRRAVKQ